MSKVLVIAPHMDDEVLGCGGTIARHVVKDDHVTVCFVANRAYNHQYDETAIQRQKDAALRVRDILGYHDILFLDLKDEQLDDKEIDIIVPLEEILKNVAPEIVYVNHARDSNQDHRAVFQAAMVACRSFANPNISRLLSYEVLSSTDQAAPLRENAFLPILYVDVEEFLDRKIEALRCYEDECRIFPHPRSPEAISALAHKRGVEVGMRAAEAFMVLREKWQ